MYDQPLRYREKKAFDEINLLRAVCKLFNDKGNDLGQALNISSMLDKIIDRTVLSGRTTV